MAKQMIKPYSFLLYFMAIIFFFFVGLAYAGLIEAGKGQMLAGGAIVLGYGVMGAFIGLVASLIFANRSNRKWIIRLNAFMAVGIVAFWAYFAIKYKNRQKEKEEMKIETPKEVTPSADVPTGSVFGGTIKF